MGWLVKEKEQTIGTEFDVLTDGVERGERAGEVRCLACGGSYEPLQINGFIYLHVCPPLSEPEVADYERRGIHNFKAGDRRPMHRSESEIINRKEVLQWSRYISGLTR